MLLKAFLVLRFRDIHFRGYPHDFMRIFKIMNIIKNISILLHATIEHALIASFHNARNDYVEHIITLSET